MKSDLVTYNGKEYLIREARLINKMQEVDEIVTVASETLGHALINDDGEPRDEVANGIDDYIYCYVNADILMGTQEELDEYVNKNFI